MQNDNRVVIKFLKKLFNRFRIPKVLISDQGKHFKDLPLEKLLTKYGFQHRLGVPYHPQSNDQVENANYDIKAILKNLVVKHRQD